MGQNRTEELLSFKLVQLRSLNKFSLAGAAGGIELVTIFDTHSGTFWPMSTAVITASSDCKFDYTSRREGNIIVPRRAMPFSVVSFTS
jgi:hypothetical protein